MRILLVEDDASIATLLAMELKARGYEVVGAKNGAEATKGKTDKLNAALNDRARQLNETLIARTRERPSGRWPNNCCAARLMMSDSQ